MDSFFDAPSYTTSGRRGLQGYVRSEDDAIVADIEIPGVDPKEVKVRVEGRTIYVESPLGNASFTVGSRIDHEQATASSKHGLLTVRVPKREAKTVEVVVEELDS